MRLADECPPAGREPPPDLVLLNVERIPSGVMTLQLAAHDRFETGAGFAIVGIMGLDPKRPKEVQDSRLDGSIADYRDARGRRQFTGGNALGYWSAPGSSGSPVFRDGGQQLAGILSLSEVDTARQEAFIVPATTVRRYVDVLVSAQVAADEGISRDELLPVLEAIGAADIPVADIPARLREFVEAARQRGAAPVSPSNEGADIDAVIGAARDRLGVLDAAGARALLQTKIDEETEMRRIRLLPLLRERAAVERLAYDHDALRLTLREIAALDAGNVWAWINLGDECVVTGSLDEAVAACRSALQAAERGGDQRNLAVSHNRLGDVLRAQGDLPGALASYRGGLAISETLAARDPGNTQWQRDLSVSHNRLGDVLVAQGDLPGALAAYRQFLAISETLAARDPGNTEWQRDLSVCHERLGDVLRAQGDLPGALAAYRQGLAIRETLAARDPGNTQWQRDIAVSLGRVADTLLRQGNPAEARPLAERALAQVHAAIARFPNDPRLSRNLPYYEGLLRRAGGAP